MMSKRVMGKASFAHLRDNEGDIQIYVRRDDVGDEAYADFKKFDIGDIIGVKGNLFRTKMGEIREKEKAAAHNAGGFVLLGLLQTRDFKVMRQNFCLDCHDIAFYFGKLYVLDVVEPFIQ